MTSATEHTWQVDLRPVVEADWPLIKSWLARPDIEDWWGPKATSEAAVMMAMSSPHALCRIIEVCSSKGSDQDRQPVGYAHALDATLCGEALPSALEPGTWDVDLFVASERHRNIGIGQQGLHILCREVFATTLAVAVCVFADVANERAVRAYEKAGFRWKQVWRTPNDAPSWFMTMDRPRQN